MNITRLAMRRPISVCVIVLAITLASVFGLEKMPRDVLPNLGVPVIYVAQPYGGLDPSQMESYITYFYEYHFLYISGVEHIESKSIQSAALIKLQFHPGTDMAEAMADTIGEVNRSKAFMPAGTVPPFVIRFDSGSAPVGKLVFSSNTRSLGELQNYALNFVRPLFATLPGVSAPPPFGASARTIVVQVDPKKLAHYDLSADQVAQAIVQANNIVPSGNIKMGNTYPIVPLNAVVEDFHELLDVPLRLGRQPTTLLRDVATVVDGTDIPTGYALVNGHRTVYIPVTKRADASTLDVVDSVKKNIPRFQSVIPEDIKVSYEFDQSGYVRNAIGSLFWEVILGAILTGAAVFLFLGDWRSVLIVVFNIPLALLSSLAALWVCRQTINIMTLGGLALAVGILVDEMTVTIENIHAHFARGSSFVRAAREATIEIFGPALLILACVLSVFLPSFFMQGVARALFVPLTLAVGFSMIGSFLLSTTLVPILSAWFLKGHSHSKTPNKGFFSRFQEGYQKFLEKLMPHKRMMVFSYLSLAAVVILISAFFIGLEIFPQVDTGQFQMRIRTPTGTSIEGTEHATLQILDLIKNLTSDHVESSVAFVGSQPPSYAVNNIYLWTSGPYEAVLEVALKHGFKMKLEDLKESIRHQLKQSLPQVKISFEPSTMVERSMSQGSPTPIEIDVSGQNLQVDHDFAKRIKGVLSQLDFIRDLQFGQRMHYPAIVVDVNRRDAGVKGLTVAQIGQALIPVTSSSRYLSQNYWADPKNGINYQVQVEVPSQLIKNPEDLEEIPVEGLNGDANPLKHYAKVASTTKVAEYDRFNMQRMISLTANLHGTDLGHAARVIAEKLKPLKAGKPRGVEVHIRGQVKALNQMLRGLGMGLALSIVIVFLMLSANFESTALSFSILSILPAVLAGALSALVLTRTTLNIESFMGTIMAVGVGVANAILLVTFAERARLQNANSVEAAIHGARDRLRPILMTTSAMIAGMIPMALGLGEGGQQTAPLGRAVIGGLVGSTFATLVVLPMAFAWIQQRRSTHGASLDTDDPTSKHFQTT